MQPRHCFLWSHKLAVGAIGLQGADGGAAVAALFGCHGVLPDRDHVRDHVRDHYSPETVEFARQLAASVSCQHPGTAGLGRVLVTAARSALICRELIAEGDGAPITAEGLANLIAAAGLALIDEETAGG